MSCALGTHEKQMVQASKYFIDPTQQSHRLHYYDHVAVHASRYGVPIDKTDMSSELRNGINRLMGQGSKVGEYEEIVKAELEEGMQPLPISLKPQRQSSLAPLSTRCKKGHDAPHQHFDCRSKSSAREGQQFDSWYPTIDGKVHIQQEMAIDMRIGANSRQLARDAFHQSNP